MSMLLSASAKVLALADKDRETKDVGFADVYHSASRYAVSPAGCVPIALPSSMLYSFERGRLILGALDAHVS